MIELTQLQALGYIATIFSAGLSLGVGVGYKIGSINKTITTTKAFCDTPPEGKTKKGYIEVEKIYANGKCSDVNCIFMQENSLCATTGKKCKYLI